MVTVSVMQVVDVEVLVQYEVVPEVVYVDVMGQSVTDVLVLLCVRKFPFAHKDLRFVEYLHDSCGSFIRSGWDWSRVRNRRDHSCARSRY